VRDTVGRFLSRCFSFLRPSLPFSLSRSLILSSSPYLLLSDPFSPQGSFISSPLYFFDYMPSCFLLSSFGGIRKRWADLPRHIDENLIFVEFQKNGSRVFRGSPKKTKTGLSDLPKLCRSSLFF
jgi:hypothetical protein